MNRTLFLFCFSLSVLNCAEKLPLGSVVHRILLQELTVTKPIEDEGRAITIINAIPEFWLSAYARKEVIESTLFKNGFNLYNNKIVVFIMDVKRSENGSMINAGSPDLLNSISAVVTKGNIECKLEKIEDKDVLDSVRPFAQAFANVYGNDQANISALILDNSLIDEAVFDGYNIGTLKITYNEMPFIFNAPVNALFLPRITSKGTPAPIDWIYDPWTGKQLK